MKKTVLLIGVVIMAILVVVSAGCTTPSPGSSSSLNTPVNTVGTTVTGTPAQQGDVSSATTFVTTTTEDKAVSSQVATKGDTVSVYYTGTFENGTVYDSNMDGTTPIQFTLGNSSVIQGFEEAVTGMSVNQVKTVTIPSDKAYGAYDPGLVNTVSRTGPIADTEFIEGQIYTVHDKTSGKYSAVKILHVTPTSVTWDANNPMAGQNFIFTIKLVKITRP